VEEVRIELLVEGINPVPWVAPSYGRGKVYKAESLTAYQESLRECIQEAYPKHPVFAQGVALRGDFFFWRQLDSGTIGEGRRRRAHVADRTNMLKSTEDALQRSTGKYAWPGLFHNDKMIVEGETKIVAQGPDVEPYILVVLTDNLDYLYNDYQALYNRFKNYPAVSPPGNVWMMVT
jgi:hypothetical protein